MKEYSELRRINVLVKLQYSVTDKETRWVKDSPYKISACYLACKLTSLSDREIAAFFNIHRQFMRNEVERYAVQLLMDPEMKGFMEELETAFREMNTIHATG